MYICDTRNDKFSDFVDKVAKYWLWYDKDDIHAGENWRESIDRGVDHCDAVIVALTRAACASEFVQYEVARALRQHKLICPVKPEAIDESKDPAKLGIPDLLAASRKP